MFVLDFIDGDVIPCSFVLFETREEALKAKEVLHERHIMSDVYELPKAFKTCEEFIHRLDTGDGVL